MATNLGNEVTKVVAEGADLVMERIFDAPRDLVWQVVTEPEHIPHWWGPRDTRTTVVEMDVRTGGRWRFLHSSPGGYEVTFLGEYLEVVPPERLTRTVQIGGDPYREADAAVETMVLEDLGDGRTRLTGRSRFPSPEVLVEALGTGMVAGAIETYDRLADLLAALATRRA